MLKKAAMEHSRSFKSLLFQGPVSCKSLKGAFTHYVRNCEAFVSSSATKETGPAISKAAEETKRNDAKEIGSRLGNRLKVLSKQFQKPTLILQK